MAYIWGWNDYFASKQPGYTGPNVDTGVVTPINQGENEGENITSSGQSGGVVYQGEVEPKKEPPSLLKPLIYATAAVAAFSLLT